ncbi:MAG: M16 family metallopeptidase [Myxococcota bacterium]
MVQSLVLVTLLAAAAPPKPFTQVASVEGITEYRLPNGLKVLFVPDESVATVTVNLTVLVGSRHEGYGEKGMAHLLEHMLFKGSTKFKDPKKEMGARGANWNGTTREDRTNYFETLPASDANLDFAIRFEADRLVNSFIDKKDLDTEMTVVRNEFEMSENRGEWVMRARVRSAALPWHNYGRAVIGIKADIERVPVDNLKAFYKRYYQPDNAVLVVAGRFDEGKAFKAIADSFGKLPKPARSLGTTFTEEPVQDGERSVTVRRVGGAPALSAAWRIPASTDPDYPALMVLQGVLGDQPQGRLHQALVETKKAASARCDLDDFKEPGLFQCMVLLKSGDDVAAARAGLLATLETVKPLTVEETERSATGWVSQMDQILTDSSQVGLFLSEWAAQGDWRMLFVQRDRMKKVTAEDLQRVWAKYFKPQNRTLGEYVPTEKPDRAEIPLPPDVGPLVNGYVGGEALAKGEAFDPAPKNIEARLRRVTLPNGAKLVLLPKKTRGQSVKVAAELRLGSLASLTGQAPVLGATVALMNRGTKKLAYKDFRSTLEKARAQLDVTGGGQALQVSASVQRPQLAQVLALLGDVLKEPALDAKELELSRNERLERLEKMKDEPMAAGPMTLNRALAPFPKDHPLYVPTFPERIAATKAVTIEQVRAFHAKFVGAQNATFVVVGDFDDKEVEQALTAMFGGWTAKEKYELIKDDFVPVAASTVTLATPDKANAWVGAGSTLALDDSAPDYPAMALAASMLGGGASSRLFVKLREEKGLSYGAYAFLDAPSDTKRAVLQSSVMFAPQNLGAVEQALQGELERWSTVSKADLDLARDELLNELKQARAEDERLAPQLAGDAQLGRTMQWTEDFEAKVRALTPEQVSAAVKKYFDPKNLVLVKAGDFKAVTAPK